MRALHLAGHPKRVPHIHLCQCGPECRAAQYNSSATCLRQLHHRRIMQDTVHLKWGKLYAHSALTATLRTWSWVGSPAWRAHSLPPPRHCPRWRTDSWRPWTGARHLVGAWLCTEYSCLCHCRGDVQKCRRVLEQISSERQKMPASLRETRRPTGRGTFGRRACGSILWSSCRLPRFHSPYPWLARWEGKS